MDFGFLWTALVTMLVTLDPLGLAPIFISLTAGMDSGQRRRIAARACLIALAILTFFGLGGQFLLDALGIGLPAFRIAGGLLLFYIAFEMTFELRAKRKQRTAARGANQPDAEKHLAAFPLAIPLLAGPGAITATILLAGRVQGDLPNALGLAGVITLGVALCFLTFIAAERVSRLIGEMGNIVLTRLLGVILAALAIQFVIDGVVAALP